MKAKSTFFILLIFLLTFFVGYTLASTQGLDPAKESLNPHPGEPCIADPVSDHLQVQVGADGLFNIGGWSPTIGWYNLTYAWPDSPWSSFSTIRIDGNNYRYGPADGWILPPTDSLDRLTNTSTTQFGDIQISQILRIVTGTTTGDLDTVMIKYRVTNIGSSYHMVGTRVMLDTMLNWNDGAPFRIPNIGAVTYEREFTDAGMPDYWQAFNDLTDTNMGSSQGTLIGGQATLPDRFVLAYWGSIVNTDWDYNINPSQPVTWDSAIGVWWNPIELAPGSTKEFVTYYGLGGVSGGDESELELSITGPNTLEIVSGGYSPNPFTVTAYVTNVSVNMLNNIDVKIDLPAGLELSPGEQAIKSLGSFNPNQSKQASWQVSALSRTTSATLPYQVTAYAVDNTNIDPVTAYRDILIPGLAANVKVNKWGPSSVAHGQSMYYAIEYKNDGVREAENVSIVDTLPNGVAFGPGSSSSGANYNYINHTVTWNIGTLPANSGTRYLSLYVYVPSGLPSGTLLTNVVTISTTSQEITLVDNRSTWDTEILYAQDPNNKSVTPEGNISAGQKLTYTVNFENVGTGSAFGVYVTDILSTDLDDSTLALGDSGIYDPGTRTIIWNIGEVGPGSGGSRSFSINARIDAPQGTEIINFATVYFPSVPEETRTNIVMNSIPISGNLTAKPQIIPSTWYTSWANDTRGSVRCHVGELANNQVVTDININTVKLNNTVPANTTFRIKDTQPGFVGKVMEVTFNRHDAFLTLGNVSVGNTKVVKISGELTDGTKFEGEATITIGVLAAPAKPTEFALLQNYPNSFNPETWIPYKLAEDTDVTIRIYNASGLLVRTLNLGHQPAASYTTKETSAYWDGRNETGEQVSSGVYFYNIQAGKFTATKKMTVQK